MLDSMTYTAAQGNTSTSTASVLYSSTTAKQTARGIRVWLENKVKLESAGFYAGSTYDLVPIPSGIMLMLHNVGETYPPVAGIQQGRVSSCKRGDVVRPIIDLHSKGLASIFAAGAVLGVTYSAGAITIKAI
jgi:hypothetical protein